MRLADALHVGLHQLNQRGALTFGMQVTSQRLVCSCTERFSQVHNGWCMCPIMPLQER